MEICSPLASIIRATNVGCFPFLQRVLRLTDVALPIDSVCCFVDNHMIRSNIKIVRLKALERTVGLKESG